MYSQLYRYITSFSLVDFKDQFYIVQVLYHVQHSKPIDIEKQAFMYLWMKIIVTEYIYMKNHQLYLSIFGYCCHLSTIFWEWQSCWDGLTLKYKNTVYVLCTLQLSIEHLHFWNVFFFNLKIYFPSVHHYKKN